MALVVQDARLVSIDGRDEEFEVPCSVENHPPMRTQVPSYTQKCSTQCSTLNDLLGGGIPCRILTELAGESGSGKSQLCLQMLLTCQLPRVAGGLEGSSLCLYTEGRFPLRRLMRLAASRRFTSCFQTEGDNPAKVLTDHVYIKEIQDGPQLLDFLHSHVTEILRSPPRGIPIRLMVLDSVAALFKSEYDNTSVEMSARSKAIFELSRYLKLLAEQFDLAVIVTNHVVESIPDDVTGLQKVAESQLGSSLLASGKVVVPALGVAWSSCVNMRLFLARPMRSSDCEAPCVCSSSSTCGAGAAYQQERAPDCKFCQHRIRLVHSPYLSKAECSFMVTDAGVCAPSRSSQVPALSEGQSQPKYALLPWRPSPEE